MKVGDNMRKINVIRGDIIFQWKYGFYFLYFLMVIIYMIMFSFFDGNIKEILVDICVYSDPAALGMFFMGALVLLEKSQRIINSIAVSPVTPSEYILGKMISVGIISEIVGVTLMSQGVTESYVKCSIGILAASFIFTLCGIIVGTGISSINQYIVGTLPFEIIGFVPVIAYRIGFMHNEAIMLLHPGCAAMRLIEGDGNTVMCIVSGAVWIIILYWFALNKTKKMFETAGGVKL